MNFKEMKDMMKINAFFYMAVIGLGLGLSSCSDDEYQRGEEPVPYNMTAYFSANNKAEYVFTPEDVAKSSTLQLEVKRLQSDDAASIPVIVVDKDDIFKIPATVEFKAGESTATLNVEYAGIEEKKLCKFSIRLDENFTDPYKKVEGSDVYAASVYVSSWRQITKNVQFWFTNINDNYNNKIFHNANFYQLEGQNRFRFEDYLGSGIDMQFTIVPTKANITFSATDPNTWVGRLEPVSNYMDGGTVAIGSYWWFMQDDTSFATWKLPLFDTTVNYINFYSNYMSEFNYVSGGGKQMTDNIWIDNKSYRYAIVNFYWTPADRTIEVPEN